ncbi:MAG: TlpA family protein disulfide reductase [Saprospiraceae bacterium]|nr:TlpA family protein disulfide reductase [Saprospiraceae bacterium]
MQKLFLLVITILLASFTSTYSPSKQFPSLSLKTLQGQNFSLEKAFAKNKLTVIDFWATWCGPCKKELDALKGLYKEWKNNGVEIIAISIDDSQQLNKVMPMVQQKQWEYTILSDVNKQSLTKLGFSSIPQTYIINQKGEIVYSHPGYTPGDEKELAKKINSLLQ